MYILCIRLIYMLYKSNFPLITAMLVRKEKRVEEQNKKITWKKINNK